MRQSRTMNPARRAPVRPVRTAAALVASVVLSAALSSASAGSAGAEPNPPDAGTPSMARGWDWPMRPFRLERPFAAPPHRYGAGHRGVDLRPLETEIVLAPASGVIAFAGQVAGRAVLTIDHGDGLVTTLEPVQSDLAPGAVVQQGSTVGHLTVGGHTADGVLHFGVRLDGEYINPLVLLGGVPRAVLLPCC